MPAEEDEGLGIGTLRLRCRSRELRSFGLRSRARDGAGRRSGAHPGQDPRDYDVAYYVRLLRETFAARLSRALTPEDFATVFSDPAQPSLFTLALGEVRPILTLLPATEAVLETTEERADVA